MVKRNNIIKDAWKLLGILLILFPAFVLTSCNDDDDEPDDPNTTTSKYKQVVIKFGTSVGEGYSEFWDVELTYTSPGGVATTVPLDFSATDEQYILDPKDEIPTNYVLKVVAKPKANASVPDDDTVYSMGHSYYFTAYGVTQDGTYVLIGGSNDVISTNHSAKGSSIKTIMSETKTIVDKTYTISL